jgi:hypothetical protein
LIDQPPRLLVGGGGRSAKEVGRVGAQLRVKGAAQQLVDRQPQRLAHDVPQRHVDAADRLLRRTAAAKEDRALVHALPENGDVEGVLAEDALAQPAGDGMAEGRFDDRLGHHGRGIDLAHAGDAGVGVDAHDERVLGAVAAFVHDGQLQPDGFDIGNFHGSPGW